MPKDQTNPMGIFYAGSSLAYSRHQCILRATFPLRLTLKALLSMTCCPSGHRAASVKMSSTLSASRPAHRSASSAWHRNARWLKSACHTAAFTVLRRQSQHCSNGIATLPHIFFAPKAAKRVHHVAQIADQGKLVVVES